MPGIKKSLLFLIHYSFTNSKFIKEKDATKHIHRTGGRTDGRTERRTDGLIEVKEYPPPFHKRGYN